MRGGARLPVCFALAACLALLLAACAYTGPGDTYNRITSTDPTRPYIGMSKAEVLACAGEPYSRYGGVEGSETLTYRYTGAGPVPGAPKNEKKKKKSPFSGMEKKDEKDWTCTASFVFEGTRLARISFAHKDARSPYAWQSESDPEKAEAMRREGAPTCQFSLPRCRKS